MSRLNTRAWIYGCQWIQACEAAWGAVCSRSSWERALSHELLKQTAELFSSSPRRLSSSDGLLKQSARGMSAICLKNHPSDPLPRSSEANPIMPSDATNGPDIQGFQEAFCDLN